MKNAPAILWTALAGDLVFGFAFHCAPVVALGVAGMALAGLLMKAER